MKNNKKKANKEKRVMAAALCITAVAVAGSTFAWFTSSDEVTNRLSANADYNVSIVESFAPPENWMPGSSVNKDVYATNTGNIGAFVNEDVSGVLTITTERPVSEFNPNCVKLTEEERYVMEAGAFLAYKPAGSNAKLGDQIVIRPGDQGDPAKTDFTPDATGLYVFRRSIVVDGSRNETFDYEGYYYDKEENSYYKISDLVTEADTTADKADDGVKTDGNLAAARSGYYELKQEVVNPVDLEYDDANHRLVASYETGVKTATQKEKEDAAKAYDDAIHDYQLAIEEQKRAASESSTVNAEVNRLYQEYLAANGELATATSTLNTATTNKANAQSAYDALSDEKDALETQRDDLLTQMYGKAPGSETDFVADTSLYAQSTKAIGESNDNQRLIDEVNTWKSSKPELANKTFNQLTYADLIQFTPSPELHTYYLDYVKKQKAIEDYTKLKGQYDTIANRLGAIGDDTAGELSTARQALDAANTAFDTAQSDFDTKKTANDNAYAAYRDALTASGAQTDNLDAADANLAAATTAYNIAKNTYEGIMDKPADSLLKFYIYLNNDVTTGGTAGKWQLDPTTIGDDNIAHFYYTSILGAGETSNKLIDRVELDSSTTKDMYKSFDFDINVALKSAQVVFDEDQETILPTAATQDIHKTPTLAEPKNIDTALTWS